jgi:hypothetical protein
MCKIHDVGSKIAAKAKTTANSARKSVFGLMPHASGSEHSHATSADAIDFSEGIAFERAEADAKRELGVTRDITELYLAARQSNSKLNAE